MGRARTRHGGILLRLWIAALACVWAASAAPAAPAVAARLDQ